jgi:hypothetical protein
MMARGKLANAASNACLIVSASAGEFWNSGMLMM